MKIEDFYKFVSFELPGCPEELMRQAIVYTAKDFCSRTHAWNVFMDPIRLVDDVAEYELEYPYGSKPVAAMAVWIGARKLDPITSNQLADALPDWQTAKSNEPRFYNAAKLDSAITVYPTPINSTAELTMRVALEPRLDSAQLPDMLLEKYADAIASGAKARLMVMPNKQWSAPANGVAYKAAYEGAVVEARIEVIHDGVPGTIRVRPRRFGA